MCIILAITYEKKGYMNRGVTHINDSGEELCQTDRYFYRKTDLLN